MQASKPFLTTRLAINLPGCVQRKHSKRCFFNSMVLPDALPCPAAVLQGAGAAATTNYHIRLFDYGHDYQDLQDICANVYGGTDYLPRIIGGIASDSRHVVLAAEALPQEAGLRQAEEREVQHLGAGRIDGVICAELRGGTVFLFGLRVREDCQGRGVGHLLMEAICKRSPKQLVTGVGASLCPVTPSMSALSLPPPPPSSLLEPPLSSSCSSSPIRHIASCTTSYNPAAQRILGRQLAGPLWQLEVWPTSQPPASTAAPVGKEAAEAGLGAQVEEGGLRESAPARLLDCLPGARTILDSDSATQALLPHWRRTTCHSKLRSAVAHLLYGNVSNACNGNCYCDCSTSDPAGLSRGLGADGKQRSCVLDGSNHKTCGNSSTCKDGHSGACSSGDGGGSQEPLLWLPLPYEVWPLDSDFIRSELAQGNIWLLSEPSGAVADRGSGGGDGGDGGGAHEDNGGNGGDGCGGGDDGGASRVVGVMLLTYFETFGQVCAGILARQNAATHAAIAHADSLHSTFLATILRVPFAAAGIPEAMQPATTAATCAPATAAAAASPCAPCYPLPALYEATGGFKDFWVYGRTLSET